MTIFIGSDHAGFDYKKEIIQYLTNKKMVCIDKGTFSNASCDYPGQAHAVANAVTENLNNAMGILICGSANGVCITANKHANIRAALCWKKEIAELSRQHNNANIICIPARFVSMKEAEEMVDVFLNTAFEGGRHDNRVNKINL